jgi:hypothetical protein
MNKLLKSSIIFVISLILAQYLIFTANFKIWRTYTTDLSGALFVLILLVIFNIIFVKFFSYNLKNNERKWISVFIIIFNCTTISGFIKSLDYSTVSFFGSNLSFLTFLNDKLTISSDGIGGLVIPRYLFFIALLIGIILWVLSQKLKQSKGLDYPFLVSSVYSFLLVPIYILNFSYFRELFNFAGIFTHTESLTFRVLTLIAFIIAVGLPLLLNKIKSKK